MLGLFRAPQSYLNYKLAGMRLPTSIYDTAIPVVFGAQRVPWKLLWYGDFVSKQQSASGKGGGKGNTYIYYAAVAALLCHGPVSGIGAVWDSQGELILQKQTETFTVPGGGGSHTVSPPASGQF